MRTSCSESEIKHVSSAPKFTCCRHFIKELVHAFSSAYIELWMHLGSLESTQEAKVALGCAPVLTLTLLSCSPNFPRASITRYTHAKHEPILNYLGVRAFQQTTNKTCEESEFGMSISEAVLGKNILNESKF